MSELIKFLPTEIEESPYMKSSEDLQSIYNRICSIDQDLVSRGYMRSIGKPVNETEEEAIRSARAYAEYMHLWDLYKEECDKIRRDKSQL